MNDTRAGFVVLLLRAPEVLEGRQRRENGTTDPDGVLALRRSDDLDLLFGNDLSIHVILCTLQRLTFMLEGARAVSSFCIRSAIPGNIVVPPESTMLP